jgi:hypothetical protein
MPPKDCGQKPWFPSFMWVKECYGNTTHDWEWDSHTTYKHGDDWGMVQMALF